MSTYAIGDVQGCFQTLQELLSHIHFNPSTDTLWFVGDLVNRGPQSLETLRFIKNLKNKKVVLGNHDFHLLASAYGVRAPHESDTIGDILKAPDCDELMNWLRHQSLLHHDDILKFTMVQQEIPWNFCL